MKDRTHFLNLAEGNYNYLRSDANEAEKAFSLLSDAYSLLSIVHCASKQWVQPESEGCEYQLYLIKRLMDDALHFIDLANPRDFKKED